MKFMRIASPKIDRTACCSTQVWTASKKWEPKGKSKGKSQGKSNGKGGEREYLPLPRNRKEVITQV